MVIFLALLVIGFADDRVIVVIVITVHIIIGLLALAILPLFLFTISEIEEADSTTRLEGSEVREVRLERPSLCRRTRGFLNFRVFHHAHLLQLP